MMVAYHIGKSDPDSVTYEITKFNGNHQKLLSVFFKVTGYELVLSKIPDPKVADSTEPLEDSPTAQPPLG